MSVTMALDILAVVMGQISLAEEAKEEAPPTYKLGEVVVTGEKLPVGVQDVISKDEIEESRSAQTVEGLFEALPGVDLRRTSFADSGNKVFLRGFDESRSLIMLDDRLLNGSGTYGGYYVDWASLSIEDIERVEVTRGAHSAKYGNTLGGAINIVTKRGTKEPETELRMLGGRFNVRHYMLSHSWGKEPFLWTISGGDYETDGYLRNNFVDRENFGARLMYLFGPRTTLSLRARYTMNENGFIVYNRLDSAYYDSSHPESDGASLGGPYVPFKGGNYDWGNESYWKDKRGQYDLEFKKGFNNGTFFSRVYLNDQDRTEYFYAIDNPDKLVLKRYSEPEHNTWGSSIGAEEHKIGRHRLDYGIEGSYLGSGGIDIKYADNSYFWFPPISSEGNEHAIKRHSAYVQDRWSLTSWAALDLGLRFDDYEAEVDTETLDEAKLSPKFGALFYPWENGKVGIHISKAYRFPTCPESNWWEAGYHPPGRKTLAPEDALVFDLEVGHKVKDFCDFTLRGYYYKVDDYIRTIFEYRPSRVVYNIDEVELKGIELGTEFKLLYGFSGFINYTYEKTHKSGDILDLSSDLTDELTEIPRSKVNLGVQYKSGIGALVKVVLRYVDERDVVTGSLASLGAPELKHMDSFATVSLQAEYPFGFGIIRAGLENIFDEEYQERYGFPMPGRTITGGININF
jgi:iron complex outermembrane receptor protein